MKRLLLSNGKWLQRCHWKIHATTKALGISGAMQSTKVKEWLKSLDKAVSGCGSGINAKWDKKGSIQQAAGSSRAKIPIAAKGSQTSASICIMWLTADDPVADLPASVELLHDYPFSCSVQGHEWAGVYPR